MGVGSSCDHVFASVWREPGNVVKLEAQAECLGIPKDMVQSVRQRIDKYLDSGGDVARINLAVLQQWGLQVAYIRQLSSIILELAATSANAAMQASPLVDDEEKYLNEEFEDFDDDDEHAEEVGAALTPPLPPLRSTSSTANFPASVGSRGTFDDSVRIVRSTARSSVVKHRIQPGAWKLGQRIGQGSFGEVYVGMDTKKGQLIAVKALLLSSDEEASTGLLQEIHLMKNLEHENIVRYLGAEIDAGAGRLYIFQEWVPGGSVASLLRKFGPFTLEVIGTYTRQLLCGLEYLHANGIVHRDIKGDNLLVNDEGVVKLADFGASKQLALLDGDHTHSVKGTPYFMAPEVLGVSKYGRRADVWSVGCTVVQMLTGEPPWKRENPRSLVGLYHIMQSTQGPPNLEGFEVPADLRDFLEQCFQRDPSVRLKVNTLLQHPFIAHCAGLSETLGGHANYDEEDGSLDHLQLQMQQANELMRQQRDEVFGRLSLSGSADGAGSLVAQTNTSDPKNDTDWPRWARPAKRQPQPLEGNDILRTQTYGGRHAVPQIQSQRPSSEGQRFRVHTTEHFQSRVVRSDVLSDGCWRCLKCDTVNEDAHGTFCSVCATVKGSSGRRAADEPVPVWR